MTRQEVVVRLFLDGPCEGEHGEVPPRDIPIWRHLDRRPGYYALYRHDRFGLRWQGEVKSAAGVADALAAEGLTPWLHEDAEVPQFRTVDIERADPED